MFPVSVNGITIQPPEVTSNLGVKPDLSLSLLSQPAHRPVSALRMLLSISTIPPQFKPGPLPPWTIRIASYGVFQHSLTLCLSTCSLEVSIVFLKCKSDHNPLTHSCKTFSGFPLNSKDKDQTHRHTLQGSAGSGQSSLLSLIPQQCPHHLSGPRRQDPTIHGVSFPKRTMSPLLTQGLGTCNSELNTIFSLLGLVNASSFSLHGLITSSETSLPL